jgi:2-iminobutanoate/2-iminopropanoate deaminase
MRIMMGLILPAALAMVSCTGGSGEPAPAERSYVEPRSGDEGLPFSGGVRIGNTLYLAGIIGIDPQTGAPPEAVEDEIRLVMDTMRTRLAAAGMTMDDLVTVQVYCPDLELYDTFNAVYRTYFRGEFPARAFIGSGPLLRGGRFEVQGIAVKR